MTGESENIPTIDMRDPDAAAKLSVVCRDVGFCYLVGHGFSSEEFQTVFRESKALFDLPVEEKQKLSDKVMSRGYTAMQEEKLDVKRQTEGDTKEGYYIGWDIPESHKLYEPAKFRGPNKWPDESMLPNFHPVMEDYHSKMTKVATNVVRLLAKGLGLEESYFDADFKEPMATLRLLHYMQKESNPDKGIFACGAHSDFGTCTLLLTDENPGLQIFYRGEWIDVPPKPNAFVMNLGDMLEVWTNGTYKSTLHRVLTKNCKDRYSIPFFFNPKFETVVECLECCTDEDNPPLYPPTTAGQHIFDKYVETHADFEPEEEKQQQQQQQQQ